MDRRGIIATGAAVVFVLLLTGNSSASIAPGVRTGRLIDIIEPPAGVGDVSFFGTALSASGGHLFVGAPFSDSPVASAGRGFLYDADSHQLLEMLTNPASGQLNYFGASAAPFGNGGFIVGGANGPGNDIAFGFDAAGTLLQTYTRPPSPGGTGGSFTAMTTFANRVYIGVSDSKDGRIFVFDADTGSLEATIADPPPLDSTDVFGATVAVTPDLVLVGAFRDPTSGPNSGTVYAFDSTTHSIRHHLINPTPLSNDQFGISLALVDRAVAVGGPFDDTAGTDSGSVYVFDPETGDLLTTIANPFPDPLDYFGRSLGTVGGHLLIPASREENLGDGGGVVYEYDPLSGDLVGAFLSPVSQFEFFGDSIASMGNKVFIGAPLNGGRVYVYQVIPEPHTWVLLVLALASLLITKVRGAFGSAL